MDFNLTKESMEMLIEEIIDAVEETENRDMQFYYVKTVLEDNGIYELNETEE